MYHFVNVDHNDTASHLTRSDCEWFLRSIIYPVQWMGLMRICCRVAVSRVSVKKMKALTVKMETETLIGKGK
jgi:hypothetical protein